jgi:hypothetical protein
VITATFRAARPAGTELDAAVASCARADQQHAASSNAAHHVAIRIMINSSRTAATHRRPATPLHEPRRERPIHPINANAAGAHAPAT